MNLAFFLKPKSMVAYLYDDCSLRRGLGKLRESGFAELPVLSREGKYLGVVSEGDFLWYLADHKPRSTALSDAKVRDVCRGSSARAMPVTTTMEELLQCAMEQNIVPVVDDSGSFIGIVGRSDILRYFAGLCAAKPSRQAAAVR